MNYRDVTLCKLALASEMYNSLTPFNKSLKLLNDDTGNNMDLANPEHRRSLLRWLNDWGCRNLPMKQHHVASDSILEWHKVHGAKLLINEKPLWDLEDGELEIATRAYGSLKNKTGAWRVRAGSQQEVRIGPTAASKILFAMRRKALMPWDEAMRSHFKCDGSAGSYFKYLTDIKELALHIGNLCWDKGFQIEELPRRLGRADSTALALINEYLWVTITRQVELPLSETLTRWIELG